MWIVYAMSGGLEIGGYKFLNNTLMKFLGDLSMEIYLTHMMMFRLVEKIHLENKIEDQNWLFFATYVIGITLTISFAWAVKYKAFPIMEKITHIMRHKII